MNFIPDPELEEELVDDSTPMQSWVTPCSRLTGRAGTGKTFTLLQRIAEDPTWGILSASTGIAAVNLGATTIHSLLGFYDEKSLLDAHLQGSVQRKLRQIMRQGIGQVIIDEDSMIPAETLDLLVRCFDEVNSAPPLEASHPLGLMLTGDFAQLPPVKAKWAWQAECWSRFEQNTTTLTKVWRQADEKFLDALGMAREGKGAECAEALAAIGVRFHPELDTSFDGTTIIPKNDKVDRFNDYVLSRQTGQKFSLRARAWGKMTKRNPMTGAEEFTREFKNVPQLMGLRIGAYVMILANCREPESGRLVYANGDCGHVASVDGTGVTVRLVRNGEEVLIGPVVRGQGHAEKPDGWVGEKLTTTGVYLPERHVEQASKSKKRYVEGQIEYYPLRLAWASTVHRSQGLSLDRVQIDFRDTFFSNPGSGYVALSRCRTAAGLRIVGSRETVAGRIRCDPRVGKWL